MRPAVPLDGPLADSAAGSAVVTDTDRPRRGVLRNGSWSALAQLAPVVVNIGMTPYVIASIGIERFGLYILLMTIGDFLASFDGGIYLSAQRFFALYDGRRDQAAAARLLLTLCLAVIGLGCTLAAVLYGVTGPLLSLFHVSAQLRGDGEFLLHCLALIVAFGVLRGLFAALLNGRQHFKATSVVTLAQYLVYALGVILALRGEYGLRGIALALVAELFASLVLLAAIGLRTVPLRSLRLLSRREIREFWQFASRTQVVGLADLLNLQSQSLIVGRALDLTRVGLFSSGANFARQLRRVPLNAIGPAGAVLASTYGSAGQAGALIEFRRLQRLWVQAVTGWMTTAAAAAWFGVTAWLGPGFGLSGEVAVILLLGFLVQLWTSMLTVYCHSIGHPEIDARFSLVTLLLGVGLAVALVVPLGVVGLVAGSAAAQLLGCIYLVLLVRSRLGRGVPTFLADVPWVAALASAVATVGLEFTVRNLVPQGPLGLVAAGLLAVPGLIVFGVLVLGPSGLHNALQHARSR